MPAKKQDNVLLACPHCGHQQNEPRTAFSTICKKCGRHFRVQEILSPTQKAPKHTPDQKRITCFECRAELDVPASAESTMCKRCGRYVDLHDYNIAGAIAKNFKTKGAFTVEPKGCVFNTETVAGDVVIRGKFHGKLIAERSLTIYSTADVKGSFTAALLIIPPENHFRWREPIKVGSAEIAGELAANLHVENKIILKSTAKFFGDITAKKLTIENGAVVVGTLRIGLKEK